MNEAQFISSGEQNCESAAQGGPLVTLCPLLPQVHRTVSPTEMLTVSGSNVNSTRPHRHIDDIAVRRWNTAHGWLAVLIQYSDRWRGVFLRRYTCPPLARFSSHQKSECKNGRDPKNQPCCIRYFHTIGPLLRASIQDIVCRNAADALRFSNRNIAQSPAKKASGIFQQQRQNLSNAAIKR